MRRLNRKMSEVMGVEASACGYRGRSYRNPIPPKSPCCERPTPANSLNNGFRSDEMKEFVYGAMAVILIAMSFCLPMWTFDLHSIAESLRQLTTK